MSTFPSILVPVAYNTQTGTGWTTTTVGNIDNGVATPDGAFIVSEINPTGTVSYTFTDVPSDVGIVTAINYNIRYKLEGNSNDTEVLKIYISGLGGALTSTATVESTNTNIAIKDKGSTALTLTSYGQNACRADWNYATIVIETSHSANMGADDSVWSIDEVEISSGTYTVGPTTTTSASYVSRTKTTLTPQGEVIDLGGAASITRRGFAYARTVDNSQPTPLGANCSVVYDDGTFGTGTFTKQITGLTQGTYYSVRAYSVNSNSIIGVGEAYSLQTETESPPSAVSLSSPADGATGQSLTQALQFVGTDPNADPLEYEIQIDTDSNLSSGSYVSALDIRKIASAGISGIAYNLSQDDNYVYVGSSALSDHLSRISKSTFVNVMPKSFTSITGVFALCNDSTYVYFASSQTPSIAIRLLKSDWTTYNSLTLTGYNTCDTYGGYVDADYFYCTMHYSPSKVVRILLSDWTTFNVLTLPSGGYTYGMYGDSTHIYCVAYSSPGIVHRILKSDFSTVSSLTLTGYNLPNSITGDSTYLYIGTFTSPGVIIRVTKSTFTVDTTKTLATGEYINNTAVDPGGTYLYTSIYTDTTNYMAAGRLSLSDFSTYIKVGGTDAEYVTSSMYCVADSYYLYNVTRMMYGFVLRLNTHYALIDKRSSIPDAGFTDVTDGGQSHPFPSGDTIQYVPQSNLTASTLYYWRARATDPTGSAEWGDFSTTRTFTTGSGTAYKSKIIIV